MIKAHIEIQELLDWLDRVFTSNDAFIDTESGRCAAGISALLRELRDRREQDYGAFDVLAKKRIEAEDRLAQFLWNNFRSEWTSYPREESRPNGIVDFAIKMFEEMLKRRDKETGDTTVWHDISSMRNKLRKVIPGWDEL